MLDPTLLNGANKHCRRPRAVGASSVEFKVAHSTRWHLYISAIQGSFLAGNFPLKLILIIDNKTAPVNYTIRACKPLQMPQEALQSKPQAN